MINISHSCGHTIMHTFLYLDEYDKNRKIVELERKKCPSCDLKNLEKYPEKLNMSKGDFLI